MVDCAHAAMGEGKGDYSLNSQADPTLYTPYTTAVEPSNQIR